MRCGLGTNVPRLTLLGGRATKRTNEESVPKRNTGYCGIIALGSTARELDLIRRVARGLKRAAPDTFIIILGATLDDAGLMASGNVFVSGSIEPDEYETAFRHHALTHLFLPTLNAVFGHPAIAAAERSSLPIAAFDWTGGSWTPRPQDLCVDPSLSEAEVANSLNLWFTRQPTGTGAGAFV